MIIIEVIEGSTRKIVIPILQDDEPLDGTGFTLTDLHITGNDGVAVNTSGDFAWEDQAAGEVRYNPDAADWVASKSPYRVRVKLTDGTGAIGYAPQGAPAEIVVRAVV